MEFNIEIVLKIPDSLRFDIDDYKSPTIIPIDEFREWHLLRMDYYDLCDDIEKFNSICSDIDRLLKKETTKINKPKQPFPTRTEISDMFNECPNL